jgi:hypothetical protein
MPVPVSQVALKFAAFAVAPLALWAALAAPAAAQFGPTPPFVPQKGPAAVWNDQQYVNENPILSADLGYGDTGAFTGVLDHKTNQLCYMISAPDVQQATGARIVADGKAVVTLKAPAGGTSGSCVAVQPAVAKAMVASPNNYTVEVDNKAYPNGGAIGVLHAWDGVEEVAPASEARG